MTYYHIFNVRRGTKLRWICQRTRHWIKWTNENGICRTCKMELQRKPSNVASLCIKGGSPRNPAQFFTSLGS